MDIQKKASSFIVIISIILVLLTGTIFIVGTESVEGPVNTEGKPEIREKITNLNLHMEFKGFKTVIEAENCVNITRPVTIIHDPAASGEKCIAIKEGSGTPPDVSGKAVYSFSIPINGLYRFWGRRWWMDSCGNSFTFIITGEKKSLVKKERSGTSVNASIPHIFGEDASYNPEINVPWKWTKGALYYFEKGSYRLTVKNREDGVKLDQILFVEHLATGGQYRPAGIE